MLSYGEDPNQYGELSLPAPDNGRPLVVLIHGGFWREQWKLDLMRPLAADLNERGYPTWNIEYRRVGESGGGYPNTLLDVAAAIDHMHHRHSPHLALIGHSAGGHLALWAAARVALDSNAPGSYPRVLPALTIGLAAVADPTAANRAGVGVDATGNFFGGDVADHPDRYRHATPNLARAAGRVVLVHGEADESVPLDQSLNQAALVARTEVLSGVDHMSVIDPQHHSWQISVDELAAL